MAEKNKVLFAEKELTIHLLLSPDPVDGPAGSQYVTESKTLLPGQYVPVEDVPPYLLKKVEDGEVEGLSVTSESRAKEIAVKAAELRSLLASYTAGNPLDSEDGYSDYLVSDSIRAANLATRAEAESGEEAPKSK